MKFSGIKKHSDKHIVWRTINDRSILKKKRPVIEIHHDRLWDLIRDNKRAICGIFVFVISTSILSSFSIVNASVANFYPTNCLGGWEHPENAEGVPSLSPDAKIEDFSIANSAHLDKSNSPLYCGGFKGDILE